MQERLVQNKRGCLVLCLQKMLAGQPQGHYILFTSYSRLEFKRLLPVIWSTCSCSSHCSGNFIFVLGVSLGKKSGSTIYEIHQEINHHGASVGVYAMTDVEHVPIFANLTELTGYFRYIYTFALLN